MYWREQLWHREIIVGRIDFFRSEEKMEVEKEKKNYFITLSPPSPAPSLPLPLSLCFSIERITSKIEFIICSSFFVFFVYNRIKQKQLNQNRVERKKKQCNSKQRIDGETEILWKLIYVQARRWSHRSGDFRWRQPSIFHLFLLCTASESEKLSVRPMRCIIKVNRCYQRSRSEGLPGVDW